MIIVNARFLTQKITGVQRFALELSRRLKKHYGNEIRFVTHPGIIHKDLASELDAEIIGFNKSHIWEQVDLYLYLLRKSNPLLISFGYTGPLLYKRQIVSIHDMAFKYYKKTFSRGFVLIYNFLIPIITRKCLHVFTVSESAKKDVSKELKLKETKISVIYNGLSDVFKMEIPNNLASSFGNYILTVSSHHPRKNYKRLIEAFTMLDDPSLSLFVIGNKVSTFKGDLNQNDYGLDERVVFLSDISDQQLVEYYEYAQLFVFPSLYEGFGIPVIEAMSRGKTCVLSEIPVFKEIGDDQVIYVDSLNVNSIKEGIEIGLSQNKRKKYYEKLPMFSWDKSTNKVIKAITQFL